MEYGGLTPPSFTCTDALLPRFPFLLLLLLLLLPFAFIRVLDKRGRAL